MTVYYGQSLAVLAGKSRESGRLATAEVPAAGRAAPRESRHLRRAEEGPRRMRRQSAVSCLIQSVGEFKASCQEVSASPWREEGQGEDTG